MVASVVLFVTLFAALGTTLAHESGGVLRYHTEGLNPNYGPSYGHICNNTQCMRDKRHLMVQSPVLPLDDYERRQRVTVLHQQYISGQQYRPHLQSFAVRPPRPIHYPQHVLYTAQNGIEKQNILLPASVPSHSQALPVQSNHRKRNMRRSRKYHFGDTNGYSNNRLNENHISDVDADCCTAVFNAPSKHDHPRNRHESPAPVYDMSHSHVNYEYGVPGLSASLSYRVSPTSPPYSSRHAYAYAHHPTHQRPPGKPVGSRVPLSGPSLSRGRPVASSLQYQNPIKSDTVRVIRVNDTCIRCPRRQLARAPRNQSLARVPRPKLRFCSRPDDSVTNFPLMVLRGPRMGSFVKEGDYTIVFKTLVPLPAKTCKYTLQVYSLRCPPLPPTQNGSFECTNGHLWGSRCYLRCEPGFLLKGLTTGYKYLLNQPNVTAAFKCVKRKRQAVWKMPKFQPICTAFFAEATTQSPVIISAPPKKPPAVFPSASAVVGLPHSKRKVSCRWPKEPLNGWASCGQRGRWKKRLFVREHLPCFRGCNAGFEPSIPLNTNRKKNRISCVAGSWVGFQVFECENRQESILRKCREAAEGHQHVICKKVDNGIRCKVECPSGFVVPKRHRAEAELDCAAGDVTTHTWPTCQSAVAPLLVNGCQNQIVENATLPLAVEMPQYRPGRAEGGPVEIKCNLTTIQRYGEFSIFCTATDLQLDSESKCTFTVLSTASSCRPFKPGPHVVARCGMPSGLLAISLESFPVGANCEFTCDTGYTLPTSRLAETYTTCQMDGAWTVTDFDLCKPLANPVTKRKCENQTFVVERIPTGGIPLELPAYADSMGEELEPMCTHTYALDYGETIVSCDFDDYEIRTRSSCIFYVTVRKP
ncbi:uncharacterized protein LOC111250852 isoform X2 [Varroa destructor]|uniref:Sushi domain-containing protein n=1 Tax=Varroa destructor TaxID=109461 RepID=A0A7M7K7U4_VARDE|nr:uncharacterized protein LOC111250852 isoform X2 [Varroa destructor]